MQQIVLNGWPRICYHRGQVLQGLVICWCRTQEDGADSADLNAIQDAIKAIIRLLTVAVGDKEMITKDFRALVASDNRLRELLLPWMENRTF